MLSRASCLFLYLSLCTSSSFSTPKKLSATALSQQFPLRLMLCWQLLASSSSLNRVLAYWLPRSECTSGLTPPRLPCPIKNADTINSELILSDIDQPTTIRENKSRKTASYSHPSSVQTYVMSETHTLSGSHTLKPLASMLSATGSLWRKLVVTLNFFTRLARMPLLRINRSTRL